ncbi:MAG: homoserine kinase [Thermus sp.]|uniref:homoserine kinase n=1 Tax=Thermus sp. TaxID=275 RepID=UPI0025E7B73B|nr:homoserine kinase [Thermus sp.]MCS6869650.1 homoserine kinase [Thermus sp.]MCS7217989.1 homoserine kinase [Thermus sp.]MCX7849344.1 homoserine kinase [Thermus sp.]MDW8017808.1 homoserine kinase [Thermus sp.]MDW8358887.1 homoserine kinase [Thermus sp.]
MGHLARLYVPATLANLGSGFDALGVALDLYLEVEAEPAREDAFFYEGEGQVAGTDNLIHQGYRAGMAALGLKAEPLAIRAFNPIPLARGMGSSSAALVAGVALADRVSGGRLGREGVFQVAARLEGHPDNVAPAVYGGFVAALSEPPLAIPLPRPEGVRFVLAVPPYPVPTPLARAALPEKVPLADAVYNLARSALWPAALYSGRLEALREACRDRLHQPHRAHLMPGVMEAIENALAAGALAAFVGGAGPTLAALVRQGAEEGVARALVGYRGQGQTLVLNLGEGYFWKET